MAERVDARRRSTWVTVPVAPISRSPRTRLMPTGSPGRKRRAARSRATAAAGACDPDGATDQRVAQVAIDRRIEAAEHHRGANRPKRRAPGRPATPGRSRAHDRTAAPSGAPARAGEPRRAPRRRPRPSAGQCQRADSPATARPGAVDGVDHLGDRRDAGDRLARETSRVSTTRRRPAGRRCRPGCRSCPG